MAVITGQHLASSLKKHAVLMLYTLRPDPLLSAPQCLALHPGGGSKPLHVALALPKLERQASARRALRGARPGGRPHAAACALLPRRYPQPWGHVVYPAPGMHFNPNPNPTANGARRARRRRPLAAGPRRNGSHGAPASGGGTANGGGAHSTSSSTNGSPNDWAVRANSFTPASGAPQGNGHAAGNGYGPAAGSGNSYGGAAGPAGNGHAGAAANGYHAAGAANGAAAPHWPPHAVAAQQAGAPAHMGVPAMAPGGYPQGAPAWYSLQGLGILGKG